MVSGDFGHLEQRCNESQAEPVSHFGNVHLLSSDQGDGWKHSQAVFIWLNIKLLPDRMIFSQSSSFYFSLYEALAFHIILSTYQPQLTPV